MLMGGNVSVIVQLSVVGTHNDSATVFDKLSEVSVDGTQADRRHMPFCLTVDPFGIGVALCRAKHTVHAFALF